MPVLPSLKDSTFNTDLRDRHLLYDYAAQDGHDLLAADKRNPKDFEKWRGLANVGDGQADRVLLIEQAAIVEGF
ncbi:hypothetical protein PMAA_088270 [Talaromyces marneffei ATCC 18224]|uniref:Uncharacterized protein n=1 Tax=Talaromyces marneffei (strain ATCC 18224 / CBS 334.59 / QM 7333) TaxID=441960 RepID=B6QDU4_TALMQ|nr:hypothetical protein PMAA_088270 [Talaromyces marneffei ATCC 18224]